MVLRLETSDEAYDLPVIFVVTPQVEEDFHNKNVIGNR
jgi:cytochrome c oxidase assembly protein Cox11